MYLGIEIGGTKLQLAVGRADGSSPAEIVRRTVDVTAGAQGILREIEAVAPSLIEKHKPTAIGVGFGGPVHVERGRTIKSHQVAGWEDVALVDWLRAKFNLPAVIENDCNAAALAEALCGAGQGSRVVFYVTVGSGIGGGLVTGGQLYHGGLSAVAEIGHLRPGTDAVSPEQTVESVASGFGITRHVQQTIHSGEARHEELDDLLRRAGGDDDALTTQHIAAAAVKGNSVAQRALGDATRTLGWAIAQVITLMGPNLIVVGGGVSLIGEAGFFDPLRKRVAEYVFPPLEKDYQIVPAALGEEVVLHGALALASKPSEG